MAASADVQTRRDRVDLWTAVIVGAVVLAVIVNEAYNSLVSMFRVPGSVRVTAAIPPETAELTLGGGVEATLTQAQLTAAGVSPVAVACLVIGVVLAAVGLMAATVLGCLVCLRMLRGEVFGAANTRILFAISFLLLIGPLAGTFFHGMGLNGVFAALGAEYEGQWQSTLALIPAYVAAIAVGVLVIVFRRGDRLQRETEGLV